MPLTCLCGKIFEPKRNSKTCSPECSKVRTARRQRAYIIAHPEQRRLTDLRYREVVSHVSMTRKVNRAVRLLFALTNRREPCRLKKINQSPAPSPTN